MYARTMDFNHEVDPAILPSHLADCLRRVSARSVTVEGNHVAFVGGLFRFVSNWNVLGPFGFGDLTIDSSTHQIQYRVSLRQLIVVGTGVCGFIFAAMAFDHAPFWQLLAVPFIWIWIVGANLAIGLPRLNRFMRRAVAAAPLRKAAD